MKTAVSNVATGQVVQYHKTLCIVLERHALEHPLRGWG